MLGLLILLLTAQDPDAPAKVDPIKPGQKGSTMDYGPFLSSTVSKVRYRRDADLVAHKAISIRLAPDVTYCFDTDLVRCAAVWKGGFLDLTGTHLVTSKGAIPTTMGGELVAATPRGPEGEVKDVRPQPHGPLPRGVARWLGLYRHGDRVVLNYTIGTSEIWELPEWKDGALVRHCRVRSGKHPEGRLFAVDGETAIDPLAFTKGGPPLWKEPVVLKGAVGSGDGAYVVDTIPVPEENPWNAWMRITGLDFFEDGRAAVCTWSGDVWIVSGIDEKLEAVSWRRYAAGLYEPLGLCIREGVVYVLGRDQITELTDLNGDGEADRYRNFNNDTHTMASYHAFAFELHQDAEGNLYYISDGQRVDPSVPLHGCLLKVSKDGSTSEVVATGLRAANGMSVGPNGEITAADNQGNWVPSSRLNWVTKGGFYGWMPHHGRAEAPKRADPPLCFLPHQIDNSSGGQIWVTSDRWGPLKGAMLHTSYGTASLFNVVYEKKGDVVQGGVVKFPLAFASGIMRGRFNPKDGQLYVAGLRGWQTAGARDACLQRVRYTGRPANTISGFKTVEGGIELGFTDPLDPEAGSTDAYAAQRWNYVWSEKYGSDEWWVGNPKKKGREPLEIESAALGADRRSVRLKFDNAPANQILLKIRAGGASLDFYFTLTTP